LIPANTPAEIYQSKLCDADRAIELLPASGSVAMPFFCGQPPGLALAMARRARAGGFDGLRLYYAHGSQGLADALFHDDIIPDAIAPHCLFPAGPDRAVLNRGRSDHRKRLFFVPCSFSQMPRLMSEYIRLDAVLLQVSPMDRGGWMSTGTVGAFSIAAAQSARIVIVEVNPRMPRTQGSAIHVRDVTAIVEHESPVAELERYPPTPTDEAIARLLAPMVHDGSCLQFGIGALPSAVASLLGNRNDLGIHTELMSDAILDLIERGQVTNRRKVYEPGRSVFTIAYGTKRLYEALHDNAGFACLPANLVNTPSIVGMNPNVVSINSFVEVDLTGQVNAEAVAGHQYSAVGGQLDFVRGAGISQNGVSILAAHATAAGGRASRIVTHLTGPSTDPRVDVHFIATEYGIADLRGKSTTERARALIAIAAPEFRDELSHGARSRNLI
jgi:itaconate CoA-transferase